MAWTFYLIFLQWQYDVYFTFHLLIGARLLPRSYWLAPFSPLFSSFNMYFREQNIRAPEENACTAGYELFIYFCIVNEALTG